MTATYIKPTKTPRWADTSSNILEPPETKKDEGWLFEEIPPSSFENWRTNLAGSWFKWVDERFFDGASKDQLLIKSPGSAVSALLITDTYVKSHLDFRVEGDDLGMEVDGVASRRVYFDAAKQSWLGWNLATSRMELYAGGTLALWADATQCFINGDLVIGDDLSLPGGLAVGIAIPTIVDDVIQLGDANLRWELNAGSPQFVFDHFGGSIDALRYDRTNGWFSWLIANTEEARLSASGLTVANGLFVGDIAGAITDDAICIGDLNFKMSYWISGATFCAIQLDTGDAFQYNRTSNELALMFGSVEKERFTGSGIAVAGGLHAGAVGTTPTAGRVSATENVQADGSVRAGLYLYAISGITYFSGDGGDSINWDGTNFKFFVNAGEELRLSASGLAVGKGLYVGSVAPASIVDNEIYAEGNVKAMGGYLYLGADDYLKWDGTNLQSFLNGVEQSRLTANGLAIAAGLYVGSAAGTPPNSDSLYAEGNVQCGSMLYGSTLGAAGTPIGSGYQTNAYMTNLYQVNNASSWLDVYTSLVPKTSAAYNLGNQVGPARWWANLYVIDSMMYSLSINWQVPTAAPSGNIKYSGYSVDKTGNNYPGVIESDIFYTFSVVKWIKIMVGSYETALPLFDWGEATYISP